MKEVTGKIFRSESQKSYSPPPSERNENEEEVKDESGPSFEFVPVVIAVGVLAFAAYKWFKK